MVLRIGRRGGWWVIAALLGLGCAGGSPYMTGEEPPVTATATPAAATGGPADAPPNHVDNNAWKRRHDLSPAERREGDRLAERIRPALAALRAAGDYDPASTRAALLGLGLEPAAVEVAPMRTPPGAVYAVRFAAVGCVIGDVRPERVMVEVTGSAAEFGCLEPFTH